MQMQLMSELGIGSGLLVVGFALLWFGMPNRIGENPRFLHGGLMQMLYPAIVLTFMVMGVAELLVASF
jgi:hypothetical protein